MRSPPSLALQRACHAMRHPRRHPACACTPLGRSSRLGAGAGEAHVYAMEQLAQPLSLVALVGGTLEYAILIRDLCLGWRAGWRAVTER
jgi:hypothetical protein